MKKITSFILSGLAIYLVFLMTRCSSGDIVDSRTEYEYGDGVLILTPMAENAVRVQFEKEHKYDLPEWTYMSNDVCRASNMRVSVDAENGVVNFYDAKKNLLTSVSLHELVATTVQGQEAYKATISFANDPDEYFTGLGQFQDGLGNLRGVSRRLTQVNTQISIPFLLSNKGYGLLWNNYGMTEYNPSDWSIEMQPIGGEDVAEVVNVTSTEGSKKEVRQRNLFGAEVDIKESGEYAVLLDVGQSMARRHNLSLDGATVVDVNNLWLPPTTSVNISLSEGRHTFVSELTKGDKPVIYLRKVDDKTTISSPVADKVDYTFFVGTADEVIASYRKLTGEVPMMPVWALGYTHCRERYHSSAEILENARTFREKQMPVDVIVQDWQWWGKYGWNSMKFDEEFYPDPSALTAELHDSLNMRLMLSVWSKIDDNSDLGKQMANDGFYIPGTTWIDFFNPKAAEAYWRNFSEKLVVHNIDAWWQDATEPENDDLVGRRVANGELAGEQVRNVYPLLVSKTVYEGLRKDDPQRRAMILTRSGFPGIQRYGSTLWSGDVGNDWETLRRQIAGGLGLMAAGHPWWTYDAGGFFRPWGNQYQDKAYIERLVRWVECATFLPLMRIHGYMSDTEPWRYGDEAEAIIKAQLELRYRLLPYIYSAAAEVSRNGSTMMRPLVFDFASDKEALKHETEYMFGKSFLVNPVVMPGVATYKTYLPKHKAGWYDFRTGRLYEGGQTVETPVTLADIPVFVKAGSIVPMGPVKQYAMEKSDEPMDICVYPGADATYVLYEDEGDNYNCEQGKYSTIEFNWDDSRRSLVISRRNGAFDGMKENRQFRVKIAGGEEKLVDYNGEAVTVK
ncbi:MAG: DUF5110 domain-containing protein [Bacteroidales bacterium]|nr:DUF5110 domain-containing protein [Bacteroidales bacterium]